MGQGIRSNQKTLLTITVGSVFFLFLTGKSVGLGAPQSGENDLISVKLPLMPFSRRPLNRFPVPDDSADIVRDHVINLHVLTPQSCP